MIASYALGLASQAVPGLTIILIACLTAAALLFCRIQAVVPPGPIFMVMAACIGAFSPADGSAIVQNLGYFALGCLWACFIAIIYSIVILRNDVPFPASAPSQLDLHAALIDALVVGVFVGAALAIAAAMGLEKAYWVPISALAVMQGVTLRASWDRHVHRIVGTVIGMSLTWVLLPLLDYAWGIAIAVTALTFLIETAVVRHYAFAAMFITPLTILLAESIAPGQSGALLIQTRLIDTIIGSLIGLLGAICLHYARLRHIIAKGLAAISPAP